VSTLVYLDGNDMPLGAESVARWPRPLHPQL